MSKSKLPARRLVLRELSYFKNSKDSPVYGYIITRVDPNFPFAIVVETFAFWNSDEGCRVISTIGGRLKRELRYDLHTDVRKLTLKRARRRLRYWSKLLKLPFVDETLKPKKEKKPAPAMKRPKRKSRK